MTSDFDKDNPITKKFFERNKKYKTIPRTRIWCPLRTCIFNNNLRCASPAIKLHLYSDGRMRCLTYKKKTGFSKVLDFFKKDIQEEFFKKEEKDKGDYIIFRELE